jgi:hypothetical protein
LGSQLPLLLLELLHFCVPVSQLLPKLLQLLLLL